MDTVERTGRRVSGPPASAILLCAIVSFQLGAALATRIFDHTGVIGAVFLRNAIGALLLLPFARPRLRGRDRRDLLPLVILGVLLATMNGCFYQALARLPQGVAVTIEFLGPLSVAVATSRRRLDLVWVFMAAAGVVMFTGTTDTQGAELTGLLFALGAAASWAGYIVAVPRVGKLWPGYDGLAGSLVVSALLLAPLGARHAVGSLGSPRILGLAVAVGVFSTALPYMLEFSALRRMPARVYGVLTSLEPVAAAAVGLLVLGQHLRPIELLAGLLIVGASVGVTQTGRERAEITPT